MHENVAKAYRGMGMEGGIARWYARNTLRDMDEFRKLAVRLSEMLPAGGDILEVAPGPGYLAVELARQARYRVTGLDSSKTFVEIAQRNAAQAKVDVDFRQGTPRPCRLRAAASTWWSAARPSRIFLSR